MTTTFESDPKLAIVITKTASLQTFYTIRYLVDNDLIDNAYRAYAYFRWVDDNLDGNNMPKLARMAFMARQKSLLEACYNGKRMQGLTTEESMLEDLIRSDRVQDSRLQSYILHMMAVMAFDAERRGRLITEKELDEYNRLLSVAVTDALHHFIGNQCTIPISSESHLAAAGAHIAHMLRDTLDDNASGYFNIPREYLETHKITPEDTESSPYRAWVKHRVSLARTYFTIGKGYLTLIKNLRCRIAGWMYIARFEPVLNAIQQNNFNIRTDHSADMRLNSKVQTALTALLRALKPVQRKNYSSSFTA